LVTLDYIYYELGNSKQDIQADSEIKTTESSKLINADYWGSFGEYSKSILNTTNKRVNNNGGNKITMNDSNPKINERIFLLCDQCFWTVTCLNKNYLEETLSKNNTCPRCNQDQLSSFPVMPNDSFTYSYSKKRGIELNFGIRRTWN
jgi:hypothetical protein